MFAYYHMKIYKSLCHFKRTIFEGVIALFDLSISFLHFEWELLKTLYACLLRYDKNIHISLEQLELFPFWLMGRHGRDRMVVGFTATYMQSVLITTNVVSLNPAQARCTQFNIM